MTPSQTPRNSTNAARNRARIKATKANCHICGKPIDYTLTTPNPLSFEVDHITPLAKGGNDTPTNTAASHRGCNSKKRARNYAPIIKRSGALD